MSLRQIAKELGVSHTLLVLWRQGKRTLPKHVEERYHELVSTNGYSGYKNPEHSLTPTRGICILPDTGLGPAAGRPAPGGDVAQRQSGRFISARS